MHSLQVSLYADQRLHLFASTSYLQRFLAFSALLFVVPTLTIDLGLGLLCSVTVTLDQVLDFFSFLLYFTYLFSKLRPTTFALSC